MNHTTSTLNVNWCPSCQIYVPINHVCLYQKYPVTIAIGSNSTSLGANSTFIQAGSIILEEVALELPPEDREPQSEWDVFD